MNRTLQEALRIARQAALTDHVIEWAGKPVGSIKKGFNQAVKLAGLPEVSPHVLRHTAAVHMVQAGVSMDEVSQYLGHSNTSITASVYARHSPQHLRKAANALEFGRAKVQ
jgi:integrase